MLAPVHRSIAKTSTTNRRESERIEWWYPRTEKLSRYIAENFENSDIVLLQEWWFNDRYEKLFDSFNDDIFERIAERRPSGPILTNCNAEYQKREDGMAILINRNSNIKPVNSQRILTGPNRIAQIVDCNEQHTNRNIRIANVHLSFPGDPDPTINNRRQAMEIQLVARALRKEQQAAQIQQAQHCVSLEILGGDFNSNSKGNAAKVLEEQHNFVNCASCTAEQSKCADIGGQIQLGVTHRTHRGEDVSVDHIFTRLTQNQQQLSQQQQQRCEQQQEGEQLHLLSSNRLRNGKSKSCSEAAMRLGYLDSKGTRVVDCYRGDLILDPNDYIPGGDESIISDHRPVTSTIEWPHHIDDVTDTDRIFLPSSFTVSNNNDGGIYNPLDPLEPPSYMDSNVNSGGIYVPLDPLEPPSYMDTHLSSSTQSNNNGFYVPSSLLDDNVHDQKDSSTDSFSLPSHNSDRHHSKEELEAAAATTTTTSTTTVAAIPFDPLDPFYLEEESNPFENNNASSFDSKNNTSTRR